METIKNFFIKYGNVFYAIVSAILIVSWFAFSSYLYMFVLQLPNTLIFNGAQLYLTLLPSFAIYYFFGEYRIYKYHGIYPMDFEESSILDDFLLKK